MTLVRVTLPDTGSEISIYDARTGANIPVKGGETVSIDIDRAYPIRVSVVTPAAQYTHKQPKEPEPGTVSSFYMAEVKQHRNPPATAAKKKR
jgi:hypothetical protein